MLIGTNLKYAREHNFRIVLESVRLFGPISRAELARRTGLTAQTVSNISRGLLEDGLILEGERKQSGRGAPSTHLMLNAAGAYSVGLDLDKDHLTAVLVDFVGEVRQRMHYELNFPSPDEALDLLESTTRQLIEREGLSRRQVWGVGVGIPGPLDISEGSVVTNVANPTAFPGWKNVAVADILAERLQLPVVLENNATASAIGERWYGAGQHVDTFFYVFFGAGLGGGLVVNGHPHEGFFGNAGELGYCLIPAVYGFEEDNASEPPHLGLLFNLPMLYRRLEQTGVNVSRPSELEALFRADHPALLNWLDTGARHLAPVLLTIEYLIDPEVIFFGGRLPDALLEGLLVRLADRIPSLRVKDTPNHPRLRIARAGVDAAAMGVATLPIYTAFAPAPSVLLKTAQGEPASGRLALRQRGTA
jgi:predicted NBD/HSP70 family sugar kinase